MNEEGTNDAGVSDWQRHVRLFKWYPYSRFPQPRLLTRIRKP